MLSPLFDILLVPFLIAMFLAVNMGGSGTAPSFSGAYGASIISREKIPGLFGLFVFLGAILAGKKVTQTLGGGILPESDMTLLLTTLILGAVAVSMFLANLLKVPQSTSQAAVFALIGPALYLGDLNTRKIFLEIIPTWFILPLVAFGITYAVARFIYKPLKSIQALRFNELGVHPLLRFVVIAASCYVAFSIGSNNVANAAGPLASMTINELGIDKTGSGPTLVMILTTLIIAPCFGIGSSLIGGRVVETAGREIIAIGPLGATLIAVVTASLLLAASLSRGIPTSLVQLNVGAILALGVAKFGPSVVFNRGAVRKIFAVWIVAPLIALGLSYVMTWLADAAGWLQR